MKKLVSLLAALVLVSPLSAIAATVDVVTDFSPSGDVSADAFMGTGVTLSDPSDLSDPRSTNPLGTTFGVSTPYSFGLNITQAGANDTGSAMFEFDFELVSTAHPVSVHTTNPASLIGLTVAWLINDVIVDITTEAVATGVKTSTVLAYDSGDVATLKISWDDIAPQSGFIDLDFRVTAVPVPAALPLMATGFFLLGFAGWRRSRYEAGAL